MSLIVEFLNVSLRYIQPNSVSILNLKYLQTQSIYVHN